MYDEPLLNLNTFISQRPTEKRALVKACEENDFCLFPALLVLGLTETVQSQRRLLGTTPERLSESAQKSWVLSKVSDLEGHQLATGIKVKECQIIQEPTVDKLDEEIAFMVVDDKSEPQVFLCQ